MTQPSLSPRAARTRSALLSAGMELLVERPVDAIAIDEFVATARVAKGSFFNHFADKRQFAIAIAKEIRLDVETWVGQINADIPDPLERLSGGMIAAAAYALANPERTAVLARSLNGTSLDSHPINAGLLQDLRGGLAAGLIELPSEQAGILYWLGACQSLMGNIIESAANRPAAEQLLANMLQLALRGLSAPASCIAKLTDQVAIQARFAMAPHTIAND